MTQRNVHGFSISVAVHSFRSFLFFLFCKLLLDQETKKNVQDKCPKTNECKDRIGSRCIFHLLSLFILSLCYFVYALPRKPVNTYIYMSTYTMHTLFGCWKSTGTHDASAAAAAAASLNRLHSKKIFSYLPKKKSYLSGSCIHFIRQNIENLVNDHSFSRRLL